MEWIIEEVLKHVCYTPTGDQHGRMGKHNVLHTGCTFFLGLDLLRFSNHCELHFTQNITDFMLY